MIVNPQAGRGAIARALPRIKEVVEQEELEYEIVETSTPGHAQELARAAVQSGIMFVVAVGGDGTVHEVVNGLMGDDGPLAPDVVLGVVPSGSGSDFIKSYEVGSFQFDNDRSTVLAFLHLRRTAALLSGHGFLG